MGLIKGDTRSLDYSSSARALPQSLRAKDAILASIWDWNYNEDKIVDKIVGAPTPAQVTVHCTPAGHSSSGCSPI